MVVAQMGNTKYIFIRESYLEYMDIGWHVICGRERLHCIFLEWDFYVFGMLRVVNIKMRSWNISPCSPPHPYHHQNFSTEQRSR